ncbi:methyltransferase domain-containing protein [Vallitalea pronyensis]|uniref:Methyltransferase domain-containing protein n=1 Tax=Vallitalea pronyensis TaxID=1348613 RepID=A0A8J8MJY3_9FIRM|nr:methyltransferase domain-containing protein [Vallitalea pronyensis]QUI23055.1 methyltransferase domain-containing protein [Vallitalea pronyensis]
MNKRVVDTWNKVAKEYGKIGPKYWDYFGQRLIEISQLALGSKVLDVGCGTGASLFPAAKKVGDYGQVIGIDIAIGMVKACEERRKKLHLSNVSILEMDAAILAFNNQKFDYVVNGFGLPYLYYTDDSFAEIRRVLANKGSFCLVTWDDQDDNPWIEGLIQKYLPPINANNTSINNNKEQNNKAILSLTDEKNIRTIFQCAGFSEITIFPESHFFSYENKDQWWAEMNANAVRGIFDRIHATGKHRLEQLKKEAFQGLDQYRTKEGYTFKRSVYYVIAKL